MRWLFSIVTLGLAFGAIRGGLIVCLIFFSISATSKTLHIGNNQERPGPNWFSKSGTYEVLDMVTTRMVAFAPEDMPVKLEQTVNKVKDITMATVGDELEFFPPTNKTLNAQQKQLMKQVISGLPQERLADIYKRYDGNTSSLSEFEKVEIFSEILSMYKGYEKEGKIEAGKAVAADKVKELEDVLSASKQALP